MRVASPELRVQNLKTQRGVRKTAESAEKSFLTAKDAKKGAKGAKKGRKSEIRSGLRNAAGQRFVISRTGLCALHTEQRVLHFAHDDKAIFCDAGVSQAFCVASTQLWSMSAGWNGMVGELVAEELGGGLGGDGGREEVALAEEASEFFEGFTLRRLLDALGEDVDFPLLTQREEQFDDVAAGAIGEHVPDEKPVDLQKVDGDAAQLRERECAGSVVIDGGIDAELLELGDDVEGRAGIGRGDAVGDFQLKGGGVDLGFAKDGADAIGQVRAGEVAR